MIADNLNEKLIVSDTNEQMTNQNPRTQGSKVETMQCSLLDPRYKDDKPDDSKKSKAKEKTIMSPVRVTLSISDKKLIIESQDSAHLVLKDLGFRDIFGVTLQTRLKGSTHCIDLHTFAREEEVVRGCLGCKTNEVTNHRAYKVFMLACDNQ